MLPDCIGFLPSFSCFYLVLFDFSVVSLDLSRFDSFLSGLNGLSLVVPGWSLVLLNCSGISCVVPDFPGFLPS